MGDLGTERSRTSPPRELPPKHTNKTTHVYETRTPEGSSRHLTRSCTQPRLQGQKTKQDSDHDKSPYNIANSRRQGRKQRPKTPECARAVYLGCTRRGLYSAKGVSLPSKHPLSAFCKTLPFKNPSKKLVFTENPLQAPFKNPSKKHLLLENLLRLRILLRSVRLHDPLGVHPITRGPPRGGGRAPAREVLQGEPKKGSRSHRSISIASDFISGKRGAELRVENKSVFRDPSRCSRSKLVGFAGPPRRHSRLNPCAGLDFHVEVVGDRFLRTFAVLTAEKHARKLR